MIFPYAPLPPPLNLGGTKRNLPFLQENLRRHEVSVLSYGTPEEGQRFRETIGAACKHMHFVNRKRPRIVNGLGQLWLLATGRSTFRQLYRKKMQQQLDELVAREKFDLIHCCTQLLGYFRFPRNVPVVSDTHEVTYDLLYRAYKMTTNKFWKLFKYFVYKFGRQDEIRICQRFDAIIAATERDSAIFCKDLPNQKIFVINNGVDSSFLEHQQVEQQPRTMVFTGLMSFHPNIHGILYFLDEIFPLIVAQASDARLYVVGAHPTRKLIKRASEQVIVTGFVEDVRPYMAQGVVFIIPLWIGGGIRGKALEAMAMKKPIVTTAIGCEGINLKHEDSALFADTPDEFARSVLRLFNDEALRMKLGEKAYANVIAGYNWKTKGQELEQVYQTVLLNRAIHSAAEDHSSTAP